MIALIRLFVDILLLRRGPQDLPAAPALLAALLIVNFLVGGLFFDPGEEQASGWAQTATDLGLQMLMAALVLQLRGFQARVLQTLSAFAGTGLLLSLILVPIVVMLTAETASVASARPTYCVPSEPKFCPCMTKWTATFPITIPTPANLRTCVT